MNKIFSIKFLPYGVWMFFFTVIPSLMIVWFTFTNEYFEFTLENICKISNHVEIIIRSIIFAIISTIICLFIAYPFSYFMTKLSKHMQKICLILVMLPMWMNLLLRTYAWMTILENNGLINNILKSVSLEPIRMINTPYAVILGMVYDFIPFMIVPIYMSINKIDSSLIEAGNDLGANDFQTFRHIIFPLSVPGIVSGISMVFVPATSTFIISQLLGGGSNVLIGDFIESQFMGTTYNPWFGSAMSFILMIIIVIIMAITNRFDKTETGSLSK